MSEQNGGVGAKEWVAEQLLRSAEHGQGIHEVLMIGGQVVDNGMTFEAVRDVRYELMKEGLIELDNHFRPQLTALGRQALENLS